ncbi:MAG TPA: hypothetical protein VGQ99_19045 [Tepidisphaeraceae bacterium]|jgi:hypothetical protein|nr:hypothetical protein [Tepidisphaeraceae bacterium]
MNEQRLRQLLVEADADVAGMALGSQDMVSAIRRRLRHRRQTQVAGASVLLCAMLVLAPLFRRSPTPLTVVDASKARAELSLIQLQADSQAATVDRMMKYQRTLNVRTSAARVERRGEPLERIQRQREVTARLLTQNAQRVSEEFGRGRGEAEYRRVIDLFPETSWASVARRRL